MAHVLLRLWKISEFLESWLVIDKSVVICVRTTSNQLKGIKCNKIGYNRRTYNQQPIIGINATKIGYNRRTYNQQPIIGINATKSATIGVHTTNNQGYNLNLTVQSFIY